MSKKAKRQGDPQPPPRAMAVRSLVVPDDATSQEVGAAVAAKTHDVLRDVAEVLGGVPHGVEAFQVVAVPHGDQVTLCFVAVGRADRPAERPERPWYAACN